MGDLVRESVCYTLTCVACHTSSMISYAVASCPAMHSDAFAVLSCIVMDGHIIPQHENFYPILSYLISSICMTNNDFYSFVSNAIPNYTTILSNIWREHLITSRKLEIYSSKKTDKAERLSLSLSLFFVSHSPELSHARLLSAIPLTHHALSTVTCRPRIPALPDADDSKGTAEVA